MKKVTFRQKIHSKARALDELRKKDRKGRLKGASINLQRPVYQPAPIKFEVLDAPSIFNLQHENVNEVLKYIADIKDIAVKGRSNLLINFEKVTEFGEGALAMLLTVVAEFKDLQSQVIIRGNNPTSEIANDILEKSGFFKFATGHVISEKNRIEKNTILTTGSEYTSQSFLPKFIRDAMDTVWNVKGRNPLVYVVTFEMMRNACDHAFRDNKAIKWHLASTHIEEENLVKFSFVDNGKGILKTLNDGILNKFLHMFKDNVDVIETAFKDGIASRTGLAWRGKGLPTIYENYNENYVRNLVVISNDVFIDFDRGIKERLQVPFSGTYYFWIVDRKCKKVCFT